MHGEILPEKQRNCLRLVGPAADALGFHLAGGTAVALHLGHRQSIDFDWFCEQFPERPEELADAFRDRGVDVAISSLARHTLHGTVGGVRVSFLMFRAPLLEPLVAWPTYGCKLASLADLAAMKLLAVSQRGTKKDFIDVAAPDVARAPGFPHGIGNATDCRSLIGSVARSRAACRVRLPCGRAWPLWDSRPPDFRAGRWQPD